MSDRLAGADDGGARLAEQHWALGQILVGVEGASRLGDVFGVVETDPDDLARAQRCMHGDISDREAELRGLVTGHQRGQRGEARTALVDQTR